MSRGQRAEVSDQRSVIRNQLSGLLFTVHRLLFTAHCSLLTDNRLLFLFLLKDRVYDIEIFEGDSASYDP